MNKSNKSHLNSSTQQMFTEYVTFNDSCSFKIIQHSTNLQKGIVSAHLKQLINGFISCIRCARA